jgi:hypothetical protein
MYWQHRKPFQRFDRNNAEIHPGMFSRESCNRGHSHRVVRRFGSAASDGPQPQGILLISTKRPGRVFPAPRNAAAFIHLPAIVRTVGLAR